MFLSTSLNLCDGACFPRVSGDVSVFQLNVLKRDWFSPRERGCFQKRKVALRLGKVFPA